MPGNDDTTPDNSPLAPSPSRESAENPSSDDRRERSVDRSPAATGFQDSRSTLPPVKNGEPGAPSSDLTDGSERSDAPRRRRLTRRWKITAAVIAVAAIWVVAAAVDVVVAAEHIHHGEAAVQSARQGFSADGILSGAPVGSLRSAESNFSTAHGLLSSPLLWPVDVLPVAGRQLRSVQDLSGAAEQVAHVGIGTVGRSQALLRLPHTAGPDRVAALQQLASLAASTHQELVGDQSRALTRRSSGPWPTSGTPFSSDLTQVRTTLARTSEAASSAATILQGPGTYLLLAGNNAEMRSGSGAFLEAGIITTGNGELHLSGMVPTSSLTLPPGAVTVSGDLAARWGWLLPGVDWRNIGLTPNSTSTGLWRPSMWKANTGQSVDGVLAIDVQGLQELLEVTGPVTTATGQVVSASTVDQLLLHDQYVGETYSSDSTARGRRAVDARRRHLACPGGQAFQVAHMANALSAAAQGRHVLLWSADPRTEAAWVGAGVAGQLQPSSAHGRHHQPGRQQAGPVPLGDRSLRIRRHRAERRHGSLTMSFTNRTPPGQSPFIAGPFPGLGTVYGEYVGIATVNLPGDARDISSPSDALRRRQRPRGPHHP